MSAPVPADPSLASILAEAERLRGEYLNPGSEEENWVALDNYRRFWMQHGPRLAAACRDAEKVIRRIVENHDARITTRLTGRGMLVYGQPVNGTGFVEAIEWLREWDAAAGRPEKGERE